MNLCKHILQIKEELDGAKAYIEDAITCKASHPDWAKLYASMSDAELTHAKYLLDIFEDWYKKETDTKQAIDPIYPSIRESILTMYSESVSCVKNMQSIYTSK